MKTPCLSFGVESVALHEKEMPRHRRKMQAPSVGAFAGPLTATYPWGSDSQYMHISTFTSQKKNGLAHASTPECHHLDTTGQHILCTPDRLAERLVLPSWSEVERLSPSILVEVGHEIVETGRCDMMETRMATSERKGRK